MLDPAAYLATSSQGGGGGDTLLYTNLKVNAVPVLATILHTAPLTVWIVSKQLNSENRNDRNRLFSIRLKLLFS